jgi:hypothetical protein
LLLVSNKQALQPWRAFAFNSLILLWCGREDLNLHEIAPASTSS